MAVDLNNNMLFTVQRENKALAFVTYCLIVLSLFLKTAPNAESSHHRLIQLTPLLRVFQLLTVVQSPIINQIYFSLCIILFL